MKLLRMPALRRRTPVHLGPQWSAPGQGRAHLVNALLIVSLLVVGVLGGAFVAVGSTTAAMLVMSLVALVVAVGLPVRAVFYLMIVLVFVVVGQLQYFARIDKSFWIPYLMALLLYIRLAAHRMSIRQGAAATVPLDGLTALSLLFFGLFVAVAVVSSAINAVPPMQWFVAGKEYVFLAAVLLAFLLGAVTVRDTEQLLRWMPWFLLAQLPVVAYQRFVVAKSRLGASPWDAVVGLFGGNPQAGGASGTMGMFSLLAIVFSVEAWKAGKSSGPRTALVCLCAFAAVVLAEVKVVIALLPMLALYVFGGSMLRRPVVGLMGLLGGLSMAVGLLMAYQFQYTSSRASEGHSLMAFVEKIVERNTSDRVISMGGADMGRVAALEFWAEENIGRDSVGTLVGHGVGATRVGGLVLGDLVKQYQIRIGRSTSAVFLWETGLLGALCSAAALAVGGLAAWRLSKRPELAPKAWLLRSCAAGLWLILLLQPYGPDYIEIAQVQVLAFLMLGTTVALSRLRRAPG